MHQLHKIKFTKEIPVVCANIATDAIDDLRSVLDQTGYATAIASGKVAPKQTYFPMADTEEGMKTAVGRCKDLPDEIVAHFRSFKPYKGGNDTLWTLNKLRQSIHTTLLPFGGLTGGMTVSRGTISGPTSLYNPVWDREKNEITYMRTGPGAEANFNFRITVSVALGEVDLVKNAPAIAVLRAMYQEVRKVLTSTEDLCRGLGLIK